MFTRTRSIVIRAMALAMICASTALSADEPARPKLTAELAKQALLKMFRSKAGQEHAFLAGKVPDEMAKFPVEPEEAGWFSWTGGVRIHAQRAIYVVTVEPKSGAPACTFVFNGEFVYKDGAWIASQLKLVQALTPTP